MMFRPPVTDSPWTLLGVYYFVLLRPKPREPQKTIQIISTILRPPLTAQPDKRLNVIDVNIRALTLDLQPQQESIKAEILGNKDTQIQLNFKLV